jgi:hypothetical protein
MLRIDLTAADVVAEDDQGRVVDFHALRHTPALRSFSVGGFITNLARTGVHPRYAQVLARHSTIDSASLCELRRTCLTTSPA